MRFHGLQDGCDCVGLLHYPPPILLNRIANISIYLKSMDKSLGMRSNSKQGSTSTVTSYFSPNNTSLGKALPAQVGPKMGPISNEVNSDSPLKT